MIIFNGSKELKKQIAAIKRSGKSIGLVPTMGALHEGHLSLINQSKSNADITVCSIFVNPAQFNDPADFKKYPVNFDSDVTKLHQIDNDILFAPVVKEIYPTGIDNLEHYELGLLGEVMEGKYRPGHFQGVCQVMSRLLKLVAPDLLFMGQKDYQQCMVIKKLLQILGMNEIVLRIGETVREPDGLAMSSRNLRLTPLQRKQAPVIYQTLQFIWQSVLDYPSEKLLTQAKSKLSEAGFKVDYLETADPDSLELIPINQKDHCIVLAAAYLEDIRLIDNMII